MNCLIVLFAILGCALAQFRQPYKPAQSGQQIAILKQSQDVNFDGSYFYSYETENGISAQEQGQPRGAGQEQIEDVQGSFQYTAPDGTPIQITYVANENGFVPQGNHLPTPPPIPAAILKSLEYNAAHPEPEEGGSRPFRRQ